jgi:Flp pilus assembly protein TadG
MRRWRAFCREDDGVTLIEFGILAIPFFTIIAAILETGLIFLAGQILDSAVQDASRSVRTGLAHSSSFDEDAFRAEICSGLYNLFDCTAGDNERLRINVAVVGDFSSAAATYPLATGESCTSASCPWALASAYDDGDGSSVVMVRAYYKWPTIVNLAGFNFATLPDGSRLLGATRVFKNEPF